jgi:hypothetical protein
VRPPGLCRWEWREFCNRSSFRPVMGFIVMTILNRLKSAKAGLGVLCLGVALFNSACAHDEESSNDSSQQHRHHAGGGHYGHGREQGQGQGGMFDQSNPFGSPSPVPGE